MSNDLHRAFKWGIRATLQLSQYVHDVDNKPGLITKVLSYYRSCSMSGSCVLVCRMCLLSCPLLLCIHGNTCPWGQLPAIEQCLNRLVLINNIVRHIHLVHTNASQGVNMDCIHSSRGNILIGRSTRVDSSMVLMAS